MGVDMQNKKFGEKELQRRLEAAQGLGEAGRNYGGVGVEKVKKNQFGADKRLKDIPASTNFARMYTTTSTALTNVADRSATSNKHAVIQQIAGASREKEPANDPGFNCFPAKSTAVESALQNNSDVDKGSNHAEVKIPTVGKEQIPAHELLNLGKTSVAPSEIGAHFNAPGQIQSSLPFHVSTVQAGCHSRLTADALGDHVDVMELEYATSTNPKEVLSRAVLSNLETTDEVQTASDRANTEVIEPNVTLDVEEANCEAFKGSSMGNVEAKQVQRSTEKAHAANRVLKHIGSLKTYVAKNSPTAVHSISKDVGHFLEIATHS